ncbi:MAG: hypothetical protein ACT6Q8_24230 [Niveispirillum sp.]|uniref:hypothetical protein n=1 Tax=Niveispirillum sp. TaxID=1917217 RepID=UPI0040364F05
MTETAGLEIQLSATGAEAVRRALTGVAASLRGLGRSVSAPLESARQSADRTTAALRTLAGAARAIGGRAISIGTTGVTTGLVSVTAAAAATSVALSAARDDILAVERASRGAGFNSAESFQRFAFAARLSGVELEDVRGAIAGLQDALVEASRNAESDQALSFRTLGVSVLDAAGKLRSAEDVILDVADSLSRLENGPRRTFLLQRITGEDDAAKLIPLLERGSKAIREIGAEADGLGVVFDRGQVKAAEEFDRGLFRIGAVLRGVRARLLELTTVRFGSWLNTIADIAVRNRDAIDAFLVRGVDAAALLFADLTRIAQGQRALHFSWINDTIAEYNRFRDFLAVVGQDITAALSGRRDDIADQRIRAVYDIAVDTAVAARLLASTLSRVATTAAKIGADLSAVFAFIDRQFGSILGAAADFGRLIARALGLENNTQLLALVAILKLVSAAILSTVGIALRVLAPVGALIASIGGSAQAVLAPLTRLIASIGGIGRVIGIAAAALAGVVGWPVTVAVAIGAGLAVISTFWDEIRSGADSLYVSLVAGINGFFRNAQAAFAGLGDIDFRALFRGFFDTIGEMYVEIQRFIVEGGVKAFASLSSEAAVIWRNLVQLLVYDLDWQAIGDTILAVLRITADAILALMIETSAAILRAIQFILIDPLAFLLRAAWDGLVAGFDLAAAAIATRFDALVSRLKAAAASVAAALGIGGDDQQTQATQTGSAIVSRAVGGYVSGPGSGTSDSILARLSNGEYVLPARIVRQLGMPFLEALRRRGLDALSMLQGFADGGLVAAGPRLAMPQQMSASSSGGRPFVLQLPGGESFAGRMQQDVAQQLGSTLRRSYAARVGKLPRWAG